MEFDDFGDILSFNDVLFLLGISKSTLLKLLHNGAIPAFRVGRQWRFNKSRLIAYTQKQQNNGQASF
ncbi:helix-turn-helix domain-containing protein [Lachnospiraceae bacterium MD335]|jgi:excisionase family DNA binding protein|nr:excisionase family DNA binding domain-containing protein [Lachnospiraceae bacterium MD335]NDO51217.1 helix-turn-helix domain-containing protein [Lachnospiraceae bacterium MD335]